MVVVVGADSKLFAVHFTSMRAFVMRAEYLTVFYFPKSRSEFNQIEKRRCVGERLLGDEKFQKLAVNQVPPIVTCSGFFQPAFLEPDLLKKENTEYQSTQSISVMTLFSL